MWERQEVAPIDNCIKQYQHAQAGTLDVEVSHFWALRPTRGAQDGVHAAKRRHAGTP